MLLRRAPRILLGITITFFKLKFAACTAKEILMKSKLFPASLFGDQDKVICTWQKSTHNGNKIRKKQDKSTCDFVENV